jgi:hypothetical protein
VNFVTTCTARKAAPCPAHISAKALPKGTAKERFGEWSKRLAQSKEPKTAPIDLYCGNSWAIARRIHEQHAKKIDVWVASAGHGLISIEERVVSYAATFSRTEEDFVLGPDSDSTTEEWWDLLCARRAKSKHYPYSLADIATTHPSRPLLVAFSAEYFRAAKADLTKAQTLLQDPDLLVIVSAGSKPDKVLGPNMVPCDSRLEHVFGKSRMALNLRVAEALIQHFPEKQLRASNVAAHLSEILEGLPPSKYPDRTPSTDDEVNAFLRKRTSISDNHSYTGLLREYRATGRACEQRRFRSLYRRFVESNLLLTP